jgi:DNA-binding beta-propeller fold protein YncE
VYVADQQNHRVQQFTPTGQFVATWGSQGSDPGQFDALQGVCCDATTGAIYVADTYNCRIQKFSGDSPVSVRDMTWGRTKAMFKSR